MRILHVTDRVSARGGADWHLLGVIDAQRERHELALAAGRDDGSAAPRCERFLLAGLDAANGAAPALDALCARWRPDVLHLHNAIAPEVIAWAAAHDAVATVQDHRSFCPGRGKLTLAQAPCREPMSEALCHGCFADAAYARAIHARTQQRFAALCRMRAVTVLSHYMKCELASAGLAPERISVVPPFVHGLDPRAPAERSPCILFVGRLVEAKGPRDALAAWRASGVDLPLVFAGTGPLRAELERAGSEVLGWVAHERLAGLYRSARALCMPSRWQEPFGIAGIEALACGVPVVAYDSGGIREWHPGGALLVPWGDVAALGHALALALRAALPVGAPSFDRAELTARLERLYRGA